MSCQPYARARRAATVEPQPSYGVSARGRPRSRLAGGAWSRSRQVRLGRVLSLDLSKSAAAPPCLVSLTRARGAPPRVEPQPSYGVSARGRPRSRLAGGAWSRSRQARLGRVLSFDLSKSAAALPCLVSLTRARGAPPRSSRSRAMGSRREAGRDRDWQGGLGLAHARRGSVRVLSLDLSKSAAALPCLVSLTRARGAPPRSSRSRAMGSRREAARDRDWQGGLVSLTPGSAR